MFGLIKSGFKKVKNALTKTRSVLGDRLRGLFGQSIDENTFDSLEQILYEADLGTDLATLLTDELRTFIKKTKHQDTASLMNFLKGRVGEILDEPSDIAERPHKKGEPFVILIVGVNGSGKTTSAAKLAHLYKEQGKKVLLAAGDTFRAAAIEQLTIWAERLGIDLVKAKLGSDASAVIYDAISKAKAGGYDVVIADTAGRLQAKTDLMHELKKVDRTIKKQLPDAPHETLLVLDATTGQNALDQAEIFHNFTPLSGLALTKLDGSAKGGIILSIYHKMKIPIRYIGLGEGVKDLSPFDAAQYVEALFAE